MKILNEIVKQQFVQREYGLAHSTYDNELDFYQLVSSGDVKALSGMLLTGDEDEAVLAARGILSDDKVRNRRISRDSASGNDFQILHRRGDGGDGELQSQ